MLHAWVHPAGPQEFSRQDKVATEKKLQTCKQELQKVQAALRKLRPDQQKLESSIGSREDAISGIKRSIAKKEKTMFATISRALGVADVREYVRHRIRTAPQPCVRVSGTVVTAQSTAAPIPVFRQALCFCGPVLRTHAATKRSDWRTSKTQQSASARSRSAWRS